MKKLTAAAAAALLYACGSAPEVPKEPAAPPARPAKVTQFYASPAAIPPGDRALLCYGVEDAKSVRLEPEVDTIAPSMARCVEVRPKGTTEYRLLAMGADGVEAQAATTLTVDPNAPRSNSGGAAPAASAAPMLIQFVTASATQVAPGGRVTICYGVQGAKSVTLSPPGGEVENSARACINQNVGATTTYTLTAVDAAGRRDSEKLTIRVQ
ncbi:MAG: hypothetical protein R2729_10815 [Bryobacteraceae bacterium]